MVRTKTVVPAGKLTSSTLLVVVDRRFVFPAAGALKVSKVMSEPAAGTSLASPPSLRCPRPLPGSRWHPEITSVSTPIRTTDLIDRGLPELGLSRVSSYLRKPPRRHWRSPVPARPGG